MFVNERFVSILQAQAETSTVKDIVDSIIAARSKENEEESEEEEEEEESDLPRKKPSNTEDRAALDV